ncbi:hypothetical protein Tco_0914686 [Tanacetum coccineum]
MVITSSCGDAAREVPVPETFHEQTDDELTEAEIKKMEKQMIKPYSGPFLLGPSRRDIYDGVDSGETCSGILVYFPLMRESIESYYHRFSKLMNDFKRNKHFLEKIASYLKFLNNLQPEWSQHVTIVHQTNDLHTADYTQLYNLLKYNQKEVNDLRAERLAKIHDRLALMENSNNPYNYQVYHQDQPSPVTYMKQPQPNNNYNPQPSFNQNYMQQPMPNPKDITDPTTAMNMALVLMAKAFKLNYSTPTNNNQRISSNPRNRDIAQPGMNLGQDRQMQMVGGCSECSSESGFQNVGNQNGLIVVLGIANQNLNPNGNGYVVAVRAEGNAIRNNGNPIRWYNCRGLGYLARNCTVRPRRRDAAYLQTQLLIAQKEEAGIQLQAEEFDLMAAAADLDEIEEVNANCILMANLQQASTSGTQTDNAPVYDSDGSAEVHNYDNCYDNEIFNMFTQEEQYTELLEPIPEPHQEQQNDSNVISDFSSVEQEGGTVDQHPATVEETRAYFESLYNNLALEVEKVNSVNQKMKETNADLTTELARYKNQEKCFEISQEKYDKLERCYQKSVYQEQCLTKKINALHLSSGKQITTLNEEISNLSKQLSTEKSTVSSLLEEKKKLKSDFKIREDELLDKQIQLENKIKELDNILVKTASSAETTDLYNGKVLLEKHDPPAVYDLEETLQLAQESRLKMKQLNKEIKPTNYAKINHLSGVFVSQTSKSREELYFSNTSKTASVSKLISIPNEEFSDDTTSSVARKFLNEDLEMKIERLLRAVVSQDIMSIVQSNFVVDTSNLHTELERTKERFENYIIKKENEYAELWNDCKDAPCVSDTLNPLSQKLKNENVELDIQVLNYAKENAHLKITYKNLFDSLKVTRAQTKTIIDSLQDKLHDTIYENAKLRAQLIDKIFEQKDTIKGTSVNT